MIIIGPYLPKLRGQETSKTKHLQIKKTTSSIQNTYAANAHSTTK